MDTDLLRQRLIDLREEKNLSQSELARQIGMDNTAISKIESRTRKVSAEELNLFSEFYDVSTDYLLGRSNKRHYYELTAKDQKAIDEELEEIVEGLSDKSGVSFFEKQH
ncbi:helix-turn-helix domain-containing protein [Lacticaseibacillus paracasei]|uniref:helix-turn-helix domain-containing protein n=1 Tax=Lacticaseibacillus paracasei TaxID=1597 RepID=UPI001CDD4631|nr:helix-turn-helix transcriptional regulator [Lacticaseibacillus paracasei]MCZ2764816.1 helix-turn-helix transcriptional regulator [Lacticaseibacillus paracasei]MCZ2768087.1 helix-turn-helix transcriptional regulator [Lacticaseibacillus paracasei]MCZ2773201.1 helix-turn-helix transcriptional regulator [Lacticaseibacillus paracasei]MCZ2776153.1 helix-turn-helix transcriptional regulator [Lacticaseibacillus paracasei]MCZ2782342.1 helix-turn-helix transcriptional regulator [Lacticaseibacillus pa